MSATLVFGAIVAGLATGSIYAIAAMGLVLTNKTSGVFNFAHGTQAAVGAFIMWELWKISHWPWPIALAASVVLAGLVGGLVLERVAVGLADKSTAARVAATVGVLIVLEGAITIRYGVAANTMPYFLPTSTIAVGGIYISYEQMIVFVLAAAAAFGLYLFFRRAKPGLAMQAVVDDPVLLGLDGTSPLAVRRQAWIVGSCFAAVSGALIAPSLALDPSRLTLLVVYSFGAAAIGRFDSMPLTYVGGLVVGVGQSVAALIVAQPFLANHISAQILQPLPLNVPFIILFVVLLVTPRAKLIQRGSRVVRRDRAVAPLSHPVVGTLAIAGAVVLALLPHLAPTKLPIFTEAAAFVVIFASLHLLIRTSGQVSLCQMAFAGIGAATYAHAMHAGIPFPIALLFAGGVSLPVGAFIAIPAIRLSGVYLAIATFGFGILVENLFFPAFILFGQELTVRANRPSIASGDRAYYYLVVVLAALCCALVLVVGRSRLGRLLRALADSPAAVTAHGADTNVIRTLAFCISAFLAGIGGALLGPVTGSATGGTFDYSVSLIIVAVLFICGRRPLVAAFVAAAAYIVGPSYSTSGEVGAWTQVIFGGLAVLVACGVVDTLRERWLNTTRAHERIGAPSPAAQRVALGAAE